MTSFRSISQNKLRIFLRKNTSVSPQYMCTILQQFCFENGLFSVFTVVWWRVFCEKKKHVLKFVHKYAFLLSKAFSFYLEKATFIGVWNVLVDNFSQLQRSSVPKLYSSSIFQSFFFFIRASEFHLTLVVLNTFLNFEINMLLIFS